jgi:biofilm PGA synthesis N-glycosyltransferase PgaC
MLHLTDWDPVRADESVGTSGQLTVLVPAYNEAESIADAVRSLQTQTVRPAEIIVIDDCSSDDTGNVAHALGVTVIRPPRNTGSKAGAQNFALPCVRRPFVMAVDADTSLAPDGIEQLCAAFADPDVGAACGFVLARHVRSLWERGRYIEYLFAFTFYKQVQDYYEKPMISSGCFSVYRTEVLRAHGGWQPAPSPRTWTSRGVYFAPVRGCGSCPRRCVIRSSRTTTRSCGSSSKGGRMGLSRT